MKTLIGVIQESTPHIQKEYDELLQILGDLPICGCYQSQKQVRVHVEKSVLACILANAYGSLYAGIATPAMIARRSDIYHTFQVGGKAKVNGPFVLADGETRPGKEYFGSPIHILVYVCDTRDVAAMVEFDIMLLFLNGGLGGLMHNINVYVDVRNIGGRQSYGVVLVFQLESLQQLMNGIFQFNKQSSLLISNDLLESTGQKESNKVTRKVSRSDFFCGFLLEAVPEKEERKEIIVREMIKPTVEYCVTNLQKCGFHASPGFGDMMVMLNETMLDFPIPKLPTMTAIDVNRHTTLFPQGRIPLHVADMYSNYLTYTIDPDEWTEMIKRVEAFNEEFGHTKISHYYWGTTDEIRLGKPSLGQWANGIRYLFYTGGLSDVLKKELDQIGFAWGVIEDPLGGEWGRMFKLLEKYKRANGHVRVHRDHKEDGSNLGLWVHKQRQNRDTIYKMSSAESII